MDLYIGQQVGQGGKLTVHSDNLIYRQSFRDISNLVKINSNELRYLQSQLYIFNSHLEERARANTVCYWYGYSLQSERYIVIVIKDI